MLENNLPSWRQDLKSSRIKEGESPSNRWVQPHDTYFKYLE